jgi:membrane protein YqaA with SNARE-associated domain
MRQKKPRIKLTILFVVLVVGFILALLVLWLTVPSIRNSKSLAVLFFYSFPSQFLIATVPHEPVFLYFSKFHPPLIVTLVAIAGTLITEYINYMVLHYSSEFSAVKKVTNSKYVERLIELFNKSPFVALLVAGFSPVPFYPFRFLVVWADYPKFKYLLAVFLSRTPRFLLLACLSLMFKIPDYILVAIFLALGIYVAIAFLISRLKTRQKHH